MLYSSRQRDNGNWKRLLFLPCIVLFFVLCVSPCKSHDLKDGIKAFREPQPQLHSALGKAEYLAEKGQFDEAIDVLSSYKSEHPGENHPLLYYETGYFSYKAGKLENAINNLQTCIEIAPKYAEGWQLLSLAWQDSGSRYSKEKKEEKPLRIRAMQSSALAMDHAVALLEDDDLRYQSGMLWLEAEKPKKTLTILEALTKKAQPKQEWFVGLSEVLKELQRTEDTAEAMEKAARVKNNTELLFHAAWLWNELEKPKRALPLLKILGEKKSVEKNWLLLLVAVYNSLQQPMEAALTFERVIEMDPNPEYLYSCGVLWLQAENPDRALKSLLQLETIEPAKADWFVAIAQAHHVKTQIEMAADAMEKAATISKNPQHIYQAGTLRLQLKEGDRAIVLLSPLADLEKPKSQWLVALANSWLLKEDYAKGATYMERGAVISGEGALYHRAGMLWRIVGDLDKTISLLKKSVASKQVKQLWRIDLASVLLDANRESEVRPVMQKTELTEKSLSNQLRYRGVVIWLNLQEPKAAYPILKILASEKRPDFQWLSAMVKTCVELVKVSEAEKILEKTMAMYPSKVKTWKLAVWFAMQQNDYINAVAAKEIVTHFEPNVKKHTEDLSRLYLLAGVPEQAAYFYKKSMGDKAEIKQRDHLIDIYLSGRMYNEALQEALKASNLENSAEHNVALGDIYYALHRYDESCSAYERAVELAGEAKPKIQIKAGYSAMKARQYSRASEIFEKVIDSGLAASDQRDAALQNLEYIKRVQQQQALVQK